MVVYAKSEGDARVVLSSSSKCIKTEFGDFNVEFTIGEKVVDELF